MTLSVNQRALALPLSSTAVTPRAANSSAPQTDSTPRNDGQVQAFLGGLPDDIRAKVGRRDQNPYRDQSSAFTQRTNEDAPTRKTRAPQNRIDETRGEDREPIYRAPILTPSLSLLQAQFDASAQRSADEDIFETRANPFAAEATAQAYVTAGAQRGTPSAAAEASVQREHQGRVSQIVPPILTSVNFTA